MPVTYEFVNKMGTVCSNMNGLRSVYCLPMKIQCVNTDDDGFLQDCDKKYCDIRCDWEPSGEIPFVKGDTIMFQTQFRDKANTDNENPTLGWGDWVYFELYDAETNTLVTDSLASPFVSGYYVAHNGRNSYQVIEIDTTDEDFPCAWYIKLIAYDQAGEEANEIDSRCSQTFKEIDGCMETHLIEGIFSQYDCVGNYYGDPNITVGQQSGSTVFAYRNITRIEGSIVKNQPEADVEDDRILVTDNYMLTTKTASQKSGLFLSNYMISWYLNIFSSGIIKIDNISKSISNFAVSYDQENPNSAIVNFEWKENCNECI